MSGNGNSNKNNLQSLNDKQSMGPNVTLMDKIELIL